MSEESTASPVALRRAMLFLGPVIGVLLADDRHQPVLVGGKPVTALVRVTMR